MPIIKRAQVVPYAPHLMFDLVNDVLSYPDFVPWCTASHITRSDSHLVEASLTFAKAGVQRTFTTINRLQPNKMIEIKLRDGPFSHLEGFWSFRPRGSGCLVVLDLNFEFNNRLNQTLFGPFFNQIASLLVDTFCARADALYADRGGE